MDPINKLGVYNDIQIFMFLYFLQYGDCIVVHKMLRYL